MLETVFKHNFEYTISEKVSNLSSDSGDSGRDDMQRMPEKTSLCKRTLLHEMRKAGCSRAGILQSVQR